ncbi:cobyrinate a,c-diamide synthase [Leptothermofonsia sp. ETS-13]|uniref:cobyrinate a,c-diamide synthase n=1 Tax=Leptothermofonsia sp. ETS-13 TaxID=3035696 RepID=UPI003BA36E39
MPLVIAGDRSGVGKTTVTLALLSCLRRRGLAVQSFKVGPDYIDPMFHRYVTRRPCRNLDSVLTSEGYVQQCFSYHTRDVAYALVEGVMGLFDGAAGRGDYASTAHVARLLGLPVLLVVDCSRMSHSIAALVHGYRSFDAHVHLAGVVLNRVGSDRHLELLKSALEPLNVPILGVLRRQDSITIPDRHLGLVPALELENLAPLVDHLAYLGETSFDWSRLLPLLATNPPSAGTQLLEIDTRPETRLENLPFELNTQHSTLKIPIAIAQDAAFNFYYQDNLDLLATLGAELIFWSPLNDSELPKGVQGLYLGGGFPEMFAAQLAENETARNAVKAAIQLQIPTYAECGGLMYLCQQIVDFEEQSHSMAGILPTTAVMGKHLTLGYRQVAALQDGLMFARGAIAWGHEFHRSHLTKEPQRPLFTLSSPAPSPTEGWHLPHLHASYIHLHWGATPEIPKQFLCNCARFCIKN